MRRLVPDFITKQYPKENKSGGFPAAGLFVDISGFSTITDALMVHGQHGAEVMASLMGAVFEPLTQCVYEHGGFIATFAGDAFTALFPLDGPAAGGHQRALAAAWQIQEEMGGVAEQITPYGRFSLAAKVGVASGEVKWGIVSSLDGARSAYYFQGAAVDGCAAAEHLANAGDIVVTSDLYAAVPGMLMAEAVVSAKGLADHYRVTAVAGALPVPRPVALDPVTPDVLSHFYPQALVTESYSGEFRHVVSMFVNLPTVRTEAQLTIFMQSVFALLDRYGGLFSRLDFGDKGSNLLLFWGAPVAYENDVERALSFVLDLQARTSIPINAGVTYRIAHAGFVGSHLREDYTCFGRGVNLAARFMTAAPRGDIWLDEGVARRAGPRFDLEFEEAMAFKGFAEKQQVYLLYERREDVQAFFNGELVGREAELVQLADFVAPLWQGRYAGALIVWGEPGIGKSRLVHAFLNDETHRVSKTCQIFLAQTDEILRESLNPFRYGLWRYFAQSKSQSETRNKRNFNRTLDRLIDALDNEALAAELDRTRSFLGALVGLRWSDSLYEQLDPQGRYDNTLNGLTRLLQAESLQRPLVIHLEDAHWLDEDSQAFLARLLRALKAEADLYPIALIATARPTGDAPLLREGLGYQEIDLAHLSPSSLARLAQGQLGSPAAPALLDLLGKRAEGNPFFAEQILRFLQEAHFLAEGEEGWYVAGGAQAAVLPVDVRAVLVARLDQLAQEVKEVAQTAAVLGREFEVRLLSQMLQQDELLSRKVAEAERAAIWSALSQLRYLFKHALLRDTAYRMQVRTRRRALHELAVQALESLYGADLEAHYGQLAYHCERAGLDEKARRYLKLAGDAAQEAYQNDQAADYYSRALDLTPERDLEMRWELLLAWEKVDDLAGKRDAQRRDLMMLQAVADQMANEQIHATVALRQSQLAFNMADYDAASTAAQQAITLARAAGDVALEADGHRLWGGVLRDQGIHGSARAQYEIARDQAREAGAETVWARSLHDLGAVSYYQTDYAGAQEYYAQALALYRRLGDRRGEGLCLRSLAVMANNLGDYSGARGRAEQALRMSREVGDRQEESRCFNTLAHVAQREGDLAAAQRCLEQALHMYRQLDDRPWEGHCLTNLGVVAWQQGDYGGARSFLDRALGIQQEIGNRWGESGCLENLGMVARDLGQYTQAQAYLRQGLAICREVGLRERESAVWNELGVVATDLTQYDQARTAYEQALALRRELGHSNTLAETLAGLAQVSHLQGDYEQAQSHISEVLARLEDSPDLSEAERPFRVHLICYRVLRWTDDERAGSVLERAYNLLRDRAARIPDEAVRRSYMQNVAAHREIVLEYAAVYGGETL